MNGPTAHLIEGKLESLLQPLCLVPSANGFSTPISEERKKSQFEDTDSVSQASKNDQFFIVGYSFRQLRLSMTEKVPHKGGISQLFRKRLAEIRSLASNPRIPQSTESSLVSCTWYKSSCSARLEFESSKKASKAKKALEQHHLFFERILSLSWNNSQREVWGQISRPIIALIVGNLDPRMSRVHFEEVLTDTLKPNYIEISPIDDFSGVEASKHVEELLRQFGAVSSFQYKAVDSVSTKVQAYATFSNREGAIAAVDSLHKAEMNVSNHPLFFCQAYHICQLPIAFGNSQLQTWNKGSKRRLLGQQTITLPDLPPCQPGSKIQADGTETVRWHRRASRIIKKVR